MTWVSISVFLLLEHLLPSILPSPSHGFTICRCFFRPFSIWASLISCCCLSIKGVEEVCHLTFLPADPFIFFKQEGAKANSGFQTYSVLLLCPTVRLSLAPLPLSVLLAKYLYRDTPGIEEHSRLLAIVAEHRQLDTPLNRHL